MKDYSVVATARYVMAICLEGPLGAINSLESMGSRATHHAEARTPDQVSRKVPVTITGDHRLQKHIEASVPEKGPWCLRRAAARREQLGNCTVRPNP
jgi:hypothetical protein